MTYILIDSQNLFFRGRYSVRGDIDEVVGMCFHIVFNSIRKCWEDFNGSHVVFAMDKRSWRKDFYPPYKKKRHDLAKNKSPAELDEDKYIYEAFDDFCEYLKEKTNCTVLESNLLEADDLIAGWVQSHPDEQHVIVSTDSDYVQLLSKNVKQYNGVSGELITVDGIFDLNGKRVLDKKTGKEKPIPDPEYALFMKIVRGDTSDNVFSSYPGVRAKSTKKKVGIEEAYQDRHEKGFAWNSFMQSTWTDHMGVEHVVADDFLRNSILIDLTKQPDEIRAIITETLQTCAVRKQVGTVGVKMMKFCSNYGLKRISENATHYAQFLNAPYKKGEQLNG